MTDPIRTVLILGPWSSGSTAITGYLARCGAWTCPPHQLTNDPRTPDSHESKAFRDALCSCFNELTLEKVQSLDLFTAFFGSWLKHEKKRAAAAGFKNIVLKHPIAALALPQIFAEVDPEILVVLRPLPEIEKSRLRRKWHSIYGIDGARLIYSAVFSNLINSSRSFTAISYSEFSTNSDLREKITASLGLSPDPEKRRDAEGWLRRPNAPENPKTLKETRI